MNRPPATTPTTPRNQDGLVDALVQTAFVIMAALSKVGAENNLSLTQLRVLAILRDRRATMTVLADYLGLEKSSLTGLVDRAEQRGLVSRVPHPTDGRALEVVLTAAGQELAGRLGAQVDRSLSPLTDSLTTPEQYRLQTLLRQLLGSDQADAGLTTS